MKKIIVILFIGYFACQGIAYAQPFKFSKNNLEAVNSFMSIENLEGKASVRVIKDTAIEESDGPTFTKLKGIQFGNGTIELKVLSRLLPNAPDYARGFIGIVFRVNDNNSAFESFYIRPTNGRSSDQLRRNHSVQYFSYPAYQFERLRKENPGQYESYADMGLNEWIQLKIVVLGSQAKLFINNSHQPALIVNDLKHGADGSGAIGLWVDVGTEGFFSDLQVHKGK